jgi:hypothetical protein
MAFLHQAPDRPPDSIVQNDTLTVEGTGDGGRNACGEGDGPFSGRGQGGTGNPGRSVFGRCGGPRSLLGLLVLRYLDANLASQELAEDPSPPHLPGSQEKGPGKQARLSPQLDRPLRLVPEHDVHPPLSRRREHARIHDQEHREKVLHHAGTPKEHILHVHYSAARGPKQAIPGGSGAGPRRGLPALPPDGRRAAVQAVHRRPPMAGGTGRSPRGGPQGIGRCEPRGREPSPMQAPGDQRRPGGRKSPWISWAPRARV